MGFARVAPGIDLGVALMLKEFTEVMADRLRKLRKDKKLSCAKLAEALKDKYKIKICTDTLKFYEAKGDHSKAGNNRAMKAEYLYCLADFYGVSTDYLLGITDEPEQNMSMKHGISREEAIHFLAEEARLCRMAPKINGCHMTEDWQRTIEVCEIAIAAIRAQEAT